VSGSRRRRADDPATRDLLIEATAEVMLEEGYAAATSRRVASKVGVNPALVHYYFPTMDDLFLAVFRSGAEANLARQRKALASGEPLRALWEVSSEPRGAGLLMEFMALANHRKEIRAEIAAYAERFRESQLTALTIILRDRGIDIDALPPALVSIQLASASRTLIQESALGITLGHEELIAFVEWFLRSLAKPGTGLEICLPFRMTAERSDAATSDVGPGSTASAP
jgi:TetR/AcrR family transcriptional regulator, regulator of autoinduction and epiphytic fitness